MESPAALTGSYEQTVNVGLRGVRVLHDRQLRRDRILGPVYIVIAVIAAVLFQTWFALLLAAAGVLFFFGLLDGQLMGVRMLFWRNPQLRHRVDVIADGQGVTFKGPESTTTMLWSRYQRMVEGRDVFVLVFGKELLQIVPKEAFATSADVDRFRELARSRLPLVERVAR